MYFGPKIINNLSVKTTKIHRKVTCFIFFSVENCVFITTLHVIRCSFNSGNQRQHNDDRTHVSTLNLHRQGWRRLPGDSGWVISSNVVCIISRQHHDICLFLFVYKSTFDHFCYIINAVCSGFNMIDVHFRWLLRQNLVMFTWYISFSDYARQNWVIFSRF